MLVLVSKYLVMLTMVNFLIVCMIVLMEFQFAKATNYSWWFLFGGTLYFGNMHGHET